MPYWSSNTDYKNYPIASVIYELGKKLQDGLSLYWASPREVYYEYGAQNPPPIPFFYFEEMSVNMKKKGHNVNQLRLTVPIVFVFREQDISSKPTIDSNFDYSPNSCTIYEICDELNAILNIFPFKYSDAHISVVATETFTIPVTENVVYLQAIRFLVQIEIEYIDYEQIYNNLFPSLSLDDPEKNVDAK